jgi:D-alanyl-lipoteichoic acid acyltransferase DltB (MBOAT superfamily)
VNDVYATPEQFGTPAIWLAVLVFFPLQLYCDFSGYSSTAVGTARKMRFDLVDNFRRPFSALTTSEFWNRWHISLSTWLRDYIYMPLVFYFRDYGKAAVVMGLMATFFVSGIWHGSGWNFIVYGLVQGAIISAEFLAGLKPARLAKTSFGRWRGRTTTYFLWALSLVFFRSLNMDQSIFVFDKMFFHIDLTLSLPKTIPKLTYVLSAFAIAFLFYFEAKHLDRWVKGEATVRREVAVASTLVIVLIALGVFHNLSFIYNQF